MMKNIRRSIKGDPSHSHSASRSINPKHISITPKSTFSITPPKKVIRALDSYVPLSDQELAFEKGDFFHVIANENDPDWYEVCNPATNAKGFVPVPYFQVLGKNERDSADSSSGERRLTDADSGYSDRGIALDSPSRVASGSMPSATSPPGHKKKPSKAGSPLYGKVLYDFKAERPDELEAREGEHIIVIAQSNEEWFVAKPIGRLGGPGLIPVGFIEIRDMVTGEAVQDTHAAVVRAGVPKVEEWKKMAAEYKNSSISLGHFDDAATKMQNMSIDDRHSQQMSPPSNGEGGLYRDSRGSSQAQGLLVAPETASVDAYSYENGRYWYTLNAIMEDGRSWSLCRFYEDFYDFQIALLDEFKEEAGHTGAARILPYMPGPVTYVTDTISSARRVSLDDYVKKLMRMPEYIQKCRLIKQLFAPRPGDVETSMGGPEAVGYRASAESHQSFDSSREPSRQSSGANLNGTGANGYPGLSAPPPHRNSATRSGSNGTIVQAHQVELRTPGELQPPRMLRQDSSMSAATGTSTNSQSAFLKIKFQYGEELIAIKVPKDPSFKTVMDRIRDKIEEPVESIQYRDEQSQSVYEMTCDDDLSVALARNPKLKLLVN